MDILIVGAGPMARMHAQAARHLGLEARAVCRSEATAAEFRQATGLPCQPGGLTQWLQAHAAPHRAIVAVGVDALLDTSLTMLAAGVRDLLVEKPAGLNLTEVDRLAAGRGSARVVVGYNRRFYPSVQMALAMIAEDGGPTSLRFDFTERAGMIAAGQQPPEVKRNWVLANSSHVIDMAFFLAGAPTTLHTQVTSSLDWHPAGARFAGVGLTDRGAAFSYHADWEAPGRWSVDVRTRRRRLLLEPLEQLHVQHTGSFALEPVALPAEPDGQKPGVLGQLRAFLDGDKALPDIVEHAANVRKIFAPIATGTPQRQ